MSSRTMELRRDCHSYWLRYDDYDSVIPIKYLERNVPTDDESVIRTLKNASYASIFTVTSSSQYQYGQH